MKMLGNLVLIEPLAKPSVTPGGIHVLPGEHRPWVDEDDQFQYRVLAVGPGRWRKGARITPEVRPGDRVLVDVKADIKHTFDDRTGRLIVDARQVQMIW